MIAPKHLRRPNITLVLDEYKDYLLLKQVITRLVKTKGIYFSCSDIVQLLDRNKELKKINTSVKRNSKPIKMIF